jgi:hypothetical protein
MRLLFLMACVDRQGVARPRRKVIHGKGKLQKLVSFGISVRFEFLELGTRP